MSNPTDPPSVPLWPRPGASALVLRGDTVLLVERSKPPRIGVWSLPGGRIEPGEPAREAARREVKEETGVEVAIEGLVDVVDVILRDADGGLGLHYTLAVFRGHWIAGEPVAASDARSARFVPMRELDGLPLTDGLAMLIRRVAVEPSRP